MGGLRFTPRTKLNDPFEVRPAFSKHADFAIDEGDPRTKEELIEVLKRSEYHNLQGGIKDMELDIYGILSLTETNTNHLMWSHYADEHNGIVLGIDKYHDFFDGNKSKKQFVRESTNSSIGTLRKVDYSISRVTKEAGKLEHFFLKSKHWVYENEIRYILPISEHDFQIGNGNESMEFFKLPSDAILSVTFGLKMKRSIVSNIMTTLVAQEKYQHLIFYKAAMCSESFDLRIHPISASKTPTINTKIK